MPRSCKLATTPGWRTKGLILDGLAFRKVAHNQSRKDRVIQINCIISHIHGPALSEAIKSYAWFFCRPTRVGIILGLLSWPRGDLTAEMF